MSNGSINVCESFVFEWDLRTHDDEDVMDAVNNELIDAANSRPEFYEIFRLLNSMKGKSQSFWDWVDDKILEEDYEHEQAWLLAGSALRSAVGWEPQDHFVDRQFIWAEDSNWMSGTERTWKNWKKTFDKHNYIDWEELKELSGVPMDQDFGEVEVETIDIASVARSLYDYDKEVK